jgi:hypothetical protein
MMPTLPVNGVVSWTPAPLQVAFTTFPLSVMLLQGSLDVPAPLYLKPLSSLLAFFGIRDQPPDGRL